jgi:hypothetical protein
MVELCLHPDRARVWVTQLCVQNRLSTMLRFVAHLISTREA